MDVTFTVEDLADVMDEDTRLRAKYADPRDGRLCLNTSIPSFANWLHFGKFEGQRLLSPSANYVFDPELPEARRSPAARPAPHLVFHRP
jgi:hypothetical protein